MELLTVPSPGMRHHVTLVRYDDSEERIAFMIRVKTISDEY
jgi:hypothetical protein